MQNRTYVLMMRIKLWPKLEMTTSVELRRTRIDPQPELTTATLVELMLMQITPRPGARGGPKLMRRGKRRFLVHEAIGAGFFRGALGHVVLATLKVPRRGKGRFLTCEAIGADFFCGAGSATSATLKVTRRGTRRLLTCEFISTGFFRGALGHTAELVASMMTMCYALSIW